MYFPLLAIIGIVIALLFPQELVSFKSLIIPMLAMIMFSMGLTQTLQDFIRVFRQPKPIMIGLALQYSVMPMLAYIIALVLGLDEQLALGLIIVGCCAGGTASNVITYLAGGNVALSISMTLVSTLLGVLLTPWLIQFYAGHLVIIEVLPMLLTICKIVLVPVLLGTGLRYCFDRHIQKIQWLLPHVSTVLIVFIIAIVVALNAARFSQIGISLILAIMLHNGLGLLIGYGVAKLCSLADADVKAVAIEVGMQNSGLGVALAIKYFAPGSALPGALFSIWHNLSGSLLAAAWSRNKTPKQTESIQTPS
ncbi:bile acid:sodium symporter family protein [Candidatus Halocynthiibacter alkanivorans]|uniref:bile acid:sodium symporter family protein n=1 Tax=Candidatus Halocynthiibacter alkanivorans TaxID=2267619 RepID=UPI000DF39D82|nr:bile acid:sodium symporter family protein [Candidatus Halocynthiibacter alkanivorans]